MSDHETTKQETSPVEAAVSAALRRQTQAARLPLQCRGAAGFTLAELLVSVGVLVLLALLATQLLNNAATIMTLGHRQMDADSQARELFDRMAIDFAQMARRSDVDYYLKSSTTANDCRLCTRQRGNDQMAFYSTVPGWSAITGAQQGPVSIIGYRINVSGTTLSNRLERLGEALVWNGATTDTRSDGRPASVIFWAPLNPWANLTNNPFDISGRDVFRFEYYYLLKNGDLSATPWYATSSVRGLQDVSAIIVDVAVLDPKNRVLLSNSDIAGLAEDLADYSGEPPGGLLAAWRATLDGHRTLPRPALSSVRLYERSFYLSPSNL
jgi:Tfp pilus assembly protein PilV